MARMRLPTRSVGPNPVERRGKGGKKERERRKEKKGEEEMSEKLQLLSRIHGDRVVGSDQSKRQSWSIQRKLRVGTKISGFHQSTRGRDFSPTRFYSWSKSHSNDMRCWSQERLCNSIPKFWD